MATCKDCIHLEACVYLLNVIGFNVNKDQNREGADKRCSAFTDKSRFVELPFKVGSEVAVIRSQTGDDRNLYITFERISHYRVHYESARMCFDSCRLSIPDCRWKKDVFTGETAHEEAEAALAERMKDET